MHRGIEVTASRSSPQPWQSLVFKSEYLSVFGCWWNFQPNGCAVQRLDVDLTPKDSCHPRYGRRYVQVVTLAYEHLMRFKVDSKVEVASATPVESCLSLTGYANP